MGELNKAMLTGRNIVQALIAKQPNNRDAAKTLQEAAQRPHEVFDLRHQAPIRSIPPLCRRVKTFMKRFRIGV